MATPIDLPALDRDIRSAACRVEKHRALLLGGREGRERATSFDPFAGLRHTATQQTMAALRELQPSSAEAPLRDGLVRWVYELLQTRIGLELAVADANAENELDPRLSSKQLAALSAESPSAPAERAGRLLTYRDAFRAILASENDALSETALLRAGELAVRVAAVRKERRERRFEAARRLELGHPFALASKVDWNVTARHLLDATEPLSIELLCRARKAESGSWNASSCIRLALGRDAQDGWPAYLGPRWLDETFAALAPRGVDVGPLPAPLGSATFLRAAMAWGFCWRNSGTARALPFCLARDPYPALAYRYGFAMASVVASPLFGRRALGLPARAAAAQSRILQTTMLIHARVIAARAILTAEPDVTAALFEEITARVFGAPLPASMRYAWPEPRVGTPAELLALLPMPSFLDDLVSRFDEDWFRNPKAGKHLAGVACGPAFDSDTFEQGAPTKIARAFEEALG